MKILGFIPARKGSKGLKNKNLVKFMGKPLIFHTIDCCKKLKFLTPFVSTDSKKILNYSKKCGIKFDYVRPKKISKDKSQITDAVFHALKWFESKNIFFDSVMILQPTSPVRDKKEVKRIYKKFMREKLSCIVTVSKSREHPYKFFKIEPKEWQFIEKAKTKSLNRQAYPKNYYIEDGAVYLFRTSFLKKYKRFIVKNITKLFISNQNPVINIDYQIDLKIAEFLKKSGLLKKQ